MGMTATAGQPKAVNVHDFPNPKFGKAIPYGVYDLASNEGWGASGSITTPPALPPPVSAAGGKRWGTGDFRARRNS